MSKFTPLPQISIKAESLPTIIIDKAEQNPLPISIRFPLVRRHLTTGDYSYIGGEHHFQVERKSLADLTGCLGVDRDRFERQLNRLRAFSFARLLIVGSITDFRAGNYRSRLDPKSGEQSLRAFEARYIPIQWESTPENAARRVELWAYWHYREMIKACKKIADTK